MKSSMLMTYLNFKQTPIFYLAIGLVKVKTKNLEKEGK